MKNSKKNVSTEVINYKELYEKTKQENTILKNTCDQYKLENSLLLERFKIAQQRKFGSSSEKNAAQDELFDEAGAPIPDDAKADVADEKETITYDRKKPQASKPKRQPLPDHLPREERIHDIPESEKTCADCGGNKTCFGKDIAEQLKVIPPQVSVIQHQRLKYCCKTCEGNISVAPKPNVLLPKSIADASLVAYTVMLKYVDHMPLYRQEAIWKRNGITLPRNTTCAWIMKAAELCKPLYTVMKKALLNTSYIQADETTVQVLNEKGRANKQKSYMWVYRKAIDGPIVIYEYQQTRQAKHVQSFLSDYQGYLQTDGYQGYDWIANDNAIKRLACMAHARRYFMDVVKASKKTKGLAHQAVALIGELYGIERDIKDLDANEKYNVRQQQSKPQLEKIKTWLLENSGKAPPKGALGKAMQYLQNHFELLCTYIDDGNLHIDNNLVENAIRPFALGKKNWLFAGHPRGADAGAILYSLLITAKEHQLNQHTYLTHVFEQIRQCKTDDDYLALLPGNLDTELRQSMTI